MKRFTIIAALAAFLFGCEELPPQGTVVKKVESAVYRDNLLYRSCEIEYVGRNGITSRVVPTELHDKLKLGDQINTIELSKEQDPKAEAIPVKDAK